MNASPAKRIAVLIDPTHPHLTGYLRGIREFTDQHPEWELYGTDLPCYKKITDPDSWRGHGCLIGTHPETSLSQTLSAACTSTVSVGRPHLRHSSVSFDRTHAITTALAHFLEQGILQIATYGPHPGRTDTTARTRCSDLNLSLLNLNRNELLPFLARQSEPTGVLTSDCAHALELLSRADDLGIEISTRLSVLSLGDDRHCRLASPGISSIPFPSRDIGYQAAALLNEQLLNWNDSPPRHELVGASRINVRSTCLNHAVSDLLVRKALRHIHLTAAHKPLRVGELARALGVSRANLADRFQKFLGTPPTEIIRQQRLTAAMRLLHQPGKLVKSVAISMGFSSSQEFARFFKNATGQTPTEFANSPKNQQIEPKFVKLHHV
ncbi:helix-turn-helix domain-containing protein [Verrucomicrobiaceae bacterium 227]